MAGIMTLRELETVQILTLQDNYVDLTASDNSEIITRGVPLRAGFFRKSILAEHGFSAVVRTAVTEENHTLLFDCGFSERGAADNAKALDVDMTQIEAVVLSHGHSDHFGGLRQLAGMTGRKNIELVAHPGVFKYPRYFKVSETSRINFPQLTREEITAAGLRVAESAAPRLLFDGAVLFLGEIPRRTEYEKGVPTAFFQQDGMELKDNIEDDSAIVMHLRGKGIVILSGCAHAGIVNTILYAKEVTGIDQVHVVMGGFHLGGAGIEPVVDRTIADFKKINPAYIVPVHCTGRKSIMRIERELPDQFILNMSGTTLTFAA